MRASIRTTVSIFFTLCLLSCGSSGDGGSTQTTDSSGEPEVLKTYGEACTEDTECDTGLCLVNEYAAFGWCTRECEVEAEPCEPDSQGSYGGWCAKFPEDFDSEPRQFCLPVCSDIYECQGLTDLWETCDPPTWKGNTMYGNATGIRVCQAPSAHGKPPVDPETCAGWEESYAELQPQIGVCKAYCDYLQTCKEVPNAAAYNLTCCAYGCIIRMTPEGVIDVPYEKELKCYVQNFSAWQGTPKVCEKPLEDCGDNPEDPRPQ